MCYLNAILIDMAYNKADGKLYAMAALNDENGEPQYGKLGHRRHVYRAS